MKKKMNVYVFKKKKSEIEFQGTSDEINESLIRHMCSVRTCRAASSGCVPLDGAIFRFATLYRGEWNIDSRRWVSTSE